MKKEEKKENLMEKIVSLCKRRGFVFPGSEIYGGLAGTWGYGHLGNELLHNIKQSWWNKFVATREDVYGIRAAILMNTKVWEASGHIAGFADPLENGEKFNTMFKTQVGAGEEAATSYLRPETAQGIFVNFKNTVDAFHPKLPFGIAQIGKAFRNEIAPRDFLFRQREFDQMELEYFVRPDEWHKFFEYWKDEMMEWMEEIGLDMKKIHDVEVAEGERAHYSQHTVDFEFEYPFGQKELFGLAYRGDFDLKNHKLNYSDPDTQELFVPHVIEPTFGVDRAVLALLLSAYAEDELGGEKRTYLKLKPALAPVKVAVFPLLRNKPELVKKAREIYTNLKQEIPSIIFDDNGNIGKRYRRQDEIGTPFCVTVDFDTIKDDTVTVRDRDTGTQERVKAGELAEFIKNKLV